MKHQLNYKIILVTVVIMLLALTTTVARIPPAGKYNTTNYPDDRKAIEALGYLQDSTVYLNDDYISVGGIRATVVVKASSIMTTVTSIIL